MPRPRYDFPCPSRLPELRLDWTPANQLGTVVYPAMGQFVMADKALAMAHHLNPAYTSGVNYEEGRLALIRVGRRHRFGFGMA
jgi:hypothetical protein